MKFKNIKKKAKNQQSPSNSRTIPARHARQIAGVEGWTDPKLLIKIYEGALKVFVVFTFIIAVIIVGIDFQKNLKVKQNIDSKRENITRNLNFWEDFISKHRNFPDAYFQASILEYKLGNTLKAKKYAERGLSLDPNSKDGIKIEKLLDK